MNRDTGPDAGDAARGVDRRMVRRVLWILGAGFALGFACVALAMWITAPHREVVTVPDVRRMSLAEARRTLAALELEIERGDSLPNPLVPAGAVLAQSPLPGREVAPRTRVRVILSTGGERRPVPNVRAFNREQALRVLTASGFRVAVDSVPDSRAAGRVVGTTPAAGALVRMPAAVRLLVSAGPPLVAVPSVLGLSEEGAAPVLRAAGLRVGEVNHVFELDQQEGVVLRQSPAAGDSVRMGSRVNLVVSTQQLPGTPVEDH